MRGKKRGEGGKRGGFFFFSFNQYCTEWLFHKTKRNAYRDLSEPVSAESLTNRAPLSCKNLDRCTQKYSFPSLHCSSGVF